MPALHRFDVPAVFLIEVVGKDVAGGIKVVQLCRPFIPPGDRNDLGMDFEGGQPLGVPEHTAGSAIGGMRVGHIAELCSHADADVFRIVPEVGYGALVVCLQVAPLRRGSAMQTGHTAYREILGVDIVQPGVPAHNERLVIPEYKAVRPLFDAVEALIDGVKQGIVVHPHDDIRRSQSFCTHLHDGVQQRVHGLADVVYPLPRAKPVTGMGIGVVQDQEIHARVV